MINLIKEIYLFDKCLYVILDKFFNQNDANNLKEKIEYITNEYKIDNVIIKLQEKNKKLSIFFKTFFENTNFLFID